MKLISGCLKLLLVSLLFFLGLLFSSEYHSPIHTIPTRTATLELITPHLHSPVDSLSKNIPRQNRLERFVQGLNATPKASYENCLPQNVYNPIQLQRYTTLEQFLSNDSKTHEISLRHYYLNNETQKYLSFHNLDIKSFQSCNGNGLQHIIHQEFIVLTDATAHIWNQRINCQEIKDLTTVVSNFIIAGNSFNHIGEVTKAIALANASWAILDCIRAAGEGIVQGLSSVVHDITHPIETVQNYVHTTITCGHYLYIALQEIDTAMEALICGNIDLLANKYIALSEGCKNIAYELSEYSKKLKARDIVKNLASAAIQCCATTRALNGFSCLFNSAHKSAFSIARKLNQNVQKSTSLMTAEGIPLRIAQQILLQPKKVSRAKDHLSQALAQFKGKKIKVGKITCLLDKSGLKHILERHHPLYWNGSLKGNQTFLNKEMNISDIISNIKKIIKQNREIIIQQGTNDMYQVDGMIGNIKYRVGFDHGRIGQFYIPSKQ